jgi:acid stress-induced BolA-like protein IbaG/YrbA
MMTVTQIRNILEKIASDLRLRDPKIEAEQSGKWIHLLISSQDFSGKSAGDRDNMIWRELEKRLDDETILAITQCYLLTPKEYRESAMAGS